MVPCHGAARVRASKPGVTFPQASRIPPGVQIITMARGGGRNPSSSGVTLLQHSARVLYLDVLKVTAIFFVVLLHASAPFVASQTPGSAPWWVGNLYDSLSRFCVPVFVMVTGALLLAGPRQESVPLFLRKRLPRVLIPFFFWEVTHYFFRLHANGDRFEASGFIGEIVQGEGPHLPVILWFVPMLVGLYLAIPFVKPFIDRASDRAVLFFLFLWVTFSVLNPLLERFLGAGINIPDPMFTRFLGYLVLGHFLHERFHVAGRGRVIGFSSLLFVASAALTASGTAMMSTAGGRFDEFLYSYHSPNVVLMSVAVFLFAKGLFAMEGGIVLPTAIRDVIQAGTALVFGVYLTHLWLIPYGFRIVEQSARGFGRLVGTPTLSVDLWAKIPLAALLAFALTLAAMWLFSKIPVVRRVAV